MVMESGAATPEAALALTVTLYDDPAAALLREAIRIKEVHRLSLEDAVATAKGDVPAPAARFERERQLLARMTDLASAARSLPDACVRHLVAWTRDRAILFPRRLPGSKVAWEFQPQRPDTDPRTRCKLEIFREAPVENETLRWIVFLDE